MNKRRGVITSFFLVLLILSGFVVLLSSNNKIGLNEKLNETWTQQVEDYKNTKVTLQDNKSIYDEFNDNGVEEFFVTILPPTSDGAVTFNELNTNVNITNDVYNNDVHDHIVDIHFDTKLDNNTDNIAPNGTMELRGQSSRRSKQKSYKIKLNEDTSLWQGNRILNLNKHTFDKFKLINKLSFDYMKALPSMTSYRTKFIKLNIRDLSDNNKEFKSLGLYTFIEQPNKDYLKAHGLDPNGYFYKAEFFEFYRNEDKLKNSDEPTFSKAEFETVLESRGGEDNGKLIEMLEEVNDYNKDINKTIDKYFDEDNMLTWLAFNILSNNYDTSSRNFLLYSSLNTDKWYFIPWDYDGAWASGNKEDTRWEFGISNYWGTAIFNRYFRYEDNVIKLNNKIEEVYKILNKETTVNMVNKYFKEIEPLIFTEPDVQNIKVTKEEYLKELKSLGEVPDINRERYYSDLKRPMPFFLEDSIVTSQQITFNWGAAFDLQGDEITYEFLLAKDTNFKEVIADEKNLKNNFISIDKVPKGKYYWRVIAYDSKGNWRYPFNHVERNYGVKSIYIN